MPSGKALKYAIQKLLAVPFTTIAPQHGSIISNGAALRYIFEQLIQLGDVGIDGVVHDNHPFDFGNLKERFEPNGN